MEKSALPEWKDGEDLCWRKLAASADRGLFPQAIFHRRRAQAGGRWHNRQACPADPEPVSRLAYADTEPERRRRYLLRADRRRSGQTLAGIPARGARLLCDVERFSSPAMPVHRLPRPVVRPSRLWTVLAAGRAAPAPLPARLCLARAAASAHCADSRARLFPYRPLRWRQHRPDPCGPATMPPARHHHRGGPRVRRRRDAGRHPPACYGSPGPAGEPATRGRRTTC